jgi:hypothetical protein
MSGKNAYIFSFKRMKIAPCKRRYRHTKVRPVGGLAERGSFVQIRLIAGSFILSRNISGEEVNGQAD